MAMMVLLGGTGYVGGAVRQCLQRRGLPHLVVCRSDVDCTDQAQLAGCIKELSPEFLINAAGYTGRPNVDACEYQKLECLRANVVLSGVVRAVCEELHLPWGHVSSGCIYAGTRPDGSGFTEDDPPNFSFRQNNCSFYSGCKALAEELLADARQCYVWRLRIPFTEVDSPRNYISKLLRYDRLLDVRNSLSQLDEFAEACVDCWMRRAEFGTYNLTNPGSVTTRQVVDMIQKSRLSEKQFRFFESEAQFMATAAKTPRSHCVLDSTKALRAGLRLSPVEEALQQAIDRWRAE